MQWNMVSSICNVLLLNWDDQFILYQFEYYNETQTIDGEQHNYRIIDYTNCNFQLQTESNFFISFVL